MVAVTYGVTRVPAAPKRCSASIRSRRAKAGSRASSTRWPRRAWSRPSARSGCTRNWLPHALDERGNRLIKTDSGDMPFGGW